jgi:hypothetical protein
VVDKQYTFEGPDGTRKLLDLFAAADTDVSWSCAGHSSIGLCRASRKGTAGVERRRACPSVDHHAVDRQQAPLLVHGHLATQCLSISWRFG